MHAPTLFAMLGFCPSKSQIKAPFFKRSSLPALSFNFGDFYNLQNFRHAVSSGGHLWSNRFVTGPVHSSRCGGRVISRSEWSLVPRDRTLSVAGPLPIHAYLHARARNFLYSRVVNSLNCRNMAFYCMRGMPAGISAARALIRLGVSKGLWISLCTPYYVHAVNGKCRKWNIARKTAYFPTILNG